MNSTALVGVMPAPSGVTANFDTSQLTDVQMSIILSFCITVGIAIISLALRIYTRLCIVHAFWWDDVAMLISLGFSFAFFGLTMKLFQLGDITPAEMLSYYLKMVLPLASVYLLAPAFTKLSILLLLWRINNTRIFRVGVYLSAFLILGYTLALEIILAAPCNPMKPNTTACVSNCGLAQAILNIGTDFIILLLPIHMLWHLNLPIRQKLILGCVFSTGIFVIIICIVRITYVMSWGDNADAAYYRHALQSSVWSNVEINIGIFCNNVIVLKPFMRRHFSTILGSANAKSGQTPSRSGKNSKQFSKVGSTRDGAFQMESMGRGDRGARVGAGGKGETGAGIVVTNSYNVDSERDADSESTEDMITSSKKIVAGQYYSPT